MRLLAAGFLWVLFIGWRSSLSFLVCWQSLSWLGPGFCQMRFLHVLVVQSLSRVWLFVIPWTAARQVSLSFTISWNLLKLMFIESVMPSNYLIFCCPLLLSSMFPSSRSFQISELFTSGGQSIGASGSVLPMNIQGLFPLGLIGLISLLSKGLSRVFPSSTVKKHLFLTAQLFYDPTLTSIHDYWKNHRFDYMDLCRQSDFSAFYCAV